MENQFYIRYCRFHAADRQKLLICGHWREQTEQRSRLLVSLDYDRLSYTMEHKEEIPNIRVYTEVEKTEYIWIHLPENYEVYEELRIFERRGIDLLEIFHMDTRTVKGLWQDIPGHIDEMKKTRQDITVSGWYIAKEQGEVCLLDSGKRAETLKLHVQRRPDVERAYPECERDWIHGFSIQAACGTGGKKRLSIRCGEDEWQTVLSRFPHAAGGRLAKFRQGMRKVQVYYQQFGMKRTVYHCIEKVGRRENTSYEIFRLKYMPGQAVLERQRSREFDYEPEFAVVVPLYRTPPKYLEAMIRSVRAQTYGKWRLYLSDGSGEESPLEAQLSRFEQEDERIRVIRNRESLRIVENTNRALSQVKEDYIVFVDHDDMLTPDALYECVQVLNRQRETEIIYTDEDKISSDGRQYYQPHFKPDFNLDLLRSANYMCHLFVVGRPLFERVGYLKAEYEGSQDYDFILRCVEATEKIVHIPKILYHWRIHPGSVAGNPDSKRYAYEAGKKAILAHYERTGIQAEVRFMSPGYYRSVYKTASEPLISVIIPNRDHKVDLQRCLASIYSQKGWCNFEVLVVENNSREPETFSYYRELEGRYDNFRVLNYEKEFNYSAIQNFAVGRARGTYLLLLNNDTYMADGDGIRELVSYCIRPDVGIVGAKLLYPDDTIQHAGVVVGLGGVAGHAFLGTAKDDPGYFCRITCAQDYSAVTAACMMVKKEVFEQAGGFDTGLQVAFNDTDFCLRVCELGYRVVYNAFSVWYHEESKTRGAEDTPEKVERFRREIDFFQRRWGRFLEQGDPAYNPNLTLDRHDFSLRV